MTTKFVLIVDGDPNDALGIARLLEDVGARLVIATDSVEALELAERRAPDLIISEVELPGSDGFDLRRSLLRDKQLAGIPFIFVAANATATMRLTGLRLGASDFIAKPVDSETLLARVTFHLHQELPEPSNKVSGTFSMISCASLLQVIEASKSTGVLRLEGGGGEGTLTFVRGTIVDAKMGELGGEDAAIELVTLEGARFSFKPLNGEAPDELSLSPQALLLDAAWLRDEVVHLEGHVPPAESRIEIVDAKALECFPNRPAWKKLVNDERQKVFALSTIALNLGIGSIRTRVMLAKGVQRKHLRVLPPGPEDEILILHEYDIIHEDGEDPASPPPVKRVRA